MTAAARPIADVQDVVREFRRGPETVRALDHVSVEFRCGQLTVAAGPSGSGKTTLLSIIAGIERPDAGRVVTHPPLPTGSSPSRMRWRQLAFVPQALALLDELTVAENVDLPARLDPDHAEPDVSTADLLAQLDIDHLAERYPSRTSGGEQQRTAIARALRLRPSLLIADEPTGHQDRPRIKLLLQVLREHAAAGAAVLIASHDQDVIAAADRVITLADGRVTSDTRTAA